MGPPGGTVTKNPAPLHSGRSSAGRRRFGRIAISVCLVLVAATAAGLPVYVRPQVDPLRHADAILILGGADHRRYPFGFSLGEQGWAPNVAVSNPNGTRDRGLTRYCATPRPDFELHCFVPDPPTTAGEGLELRRLAERYRWRTVIVVTSRPHLSRARFILEQCFDGDLVMVPTPAEISVRRWAYEYVYQTAGYVRAMLTPGC
jgi:uncharacterized SAM-binding protein YcdF (DUF218 family)